MMTYTSGIVFPGISMMLVRAYERVLDEVGAPVCMANLLA